ncbi:hypothetical protein BRC97_06945 [Halobacteriales archaeon QS_6_71_20]|nr:MAG: hypothetical protein BRC97_06945 [Halobacteriales archaeon QS_6_71_20]
MSHEDIEPADQMEVLEWYDEHAVQACTVGEYIRVRSGDAEKSCFGPRPDHDRLGWEVVEICWQTNSFLLAPRGGER